MARKGKARKGKARQGKARHGKAWQGMAWHGMAWHGKARGNNDPRRDKSSETERKERERESRPTSTAKKSERPTHGIHTEDWEAIYLLLDALGELLFRRLQPQAAGGDPGASGEHLLEVFVLVLVGACVK